MQIDYFLKFDRKLKKKFYQTKKKFLDVLYILKIKILVASIDAKISIFCFF